METFVKLLGLPVVASEHGKDIDAFIIYVHWLMLILFVGWFGYLIFCLYRFRESKNPRASYQGVQSHFSSYVEGAVVLVEAMLLIFFAIPLWAKVADDFPTKEENPLEIKVMAEQFTWNSRYPGEDGVFGSQDMILASTENKFGYDPEDEAGKDDIVPPLKDIRVPIGRPVIIHLSSLDVIHSFAVHPLRVQQDCMPGMTIPIHFMPTMEGKFMITCAQLCGNGHYSMNGFMTVESQENYDAWMAGMAPTDGDGGGFE